MKLIGKAIVAILCVVAILLVSAPAFAQYYGSPFGYGGYGQGMGYGMSPYVNAKGPVPNIAGNVGMGKGLGYGIGNGMGYGGYPGFSRYGGYPGMGYGGYPGFSRYGGYPGMGGYGIGAQGFNPYGLGISGCPFQ